MGIISKIGKNVGNIAIRGTGLAALGITAYDAHVLGKIEADTYSRTNESDRLMSAAYESMYLDQPSAIMGKVKNKIFKFHTDNNVFMPIDAVIGYFRGFGDSCIKGIVPGILGLGALLGGKISSRLSAIGLMLYAGFKVTNSFFGLNHSNELNKTYYE